MSTASVNADLNKLKSELKAWEREFRSKNGRDPTREDIKKAPGIDAKYKIYNKARKNSSSAADSTAVSGNARKDSRGPSNKPSPTASSTTAVEPVPQVEETFNPFRSPKKGGPSVSRPPSKPKLRFDEDPFAAGDEPEPTSALFLKLKKASPGNNPFASPSKKPLFMTASESSTSPSKSILKPTSTPLPSAESQAPAPPVPSTSKYVSASSPMKLRALIQQSKAADTPRTKARKRLAGDEDFTPDKRRRMDILRPAVSKGQSSEMDLDEPDDPPPEEEPEFGPTPKKTEAAARKFKPLFNSPLQADSKGKGLFAKRSVSFKVPSAPSREASQPAESSQSMTDPANPGKRPASPVRSNSALLPPSPPPAAASSKPKQRKRPRKDKKAQAAAKDEYDSSDNEREVRVIPYTRWGNLKAVKRKTDEDDEIWDFDIPRADPGALENVTEQLVEEEITVRLPTDMFGLLDLESPGRHGKEEEQLVRGIFEPGKKNSASEVWVAGEFIGEGGGERKDDDDWEEEADGWKGDADF